MPGRRDERGWEEVAKDGLRTRCCQTGTLILAPLLISSVTEGKSLNPSGFGLHRAAQRQVLFTGPSRLGMQCPIPASRSRQCRMLGWVASGCYRPSTGRALCVRIR